MVLQKDCLLFSISQYICVWLALTFLMASYKTHIIILSLIYFRTNYLLPSTLENWRFPEIPLLGRHQTAEYPGAWNCLINCPLVACPFLFYSFPSFTLTFLTILTITAGKGNFIFLTMVDSFEGITVIWGTFKCE